MIKMEIFYNSFNMIKMEILLTNNSFNMIKMEILLANNNNNKFNVIS